MKKRVILFLSLIVIILIIAVGFIYVKKSHMIKSETTIIDNKGNRVETLDKEIENYGN